MIASKYFLLPIFWLSFAQNLSICAAGKIDPTIAEYLKLLGLSEESYAEMYRNKIQADKSLVDKVVSKTTYENKYSTILALMDATVNSLYKSVDILLNTQYNPAKDPFPSNDRVLISAIATALESSVFLADILHRNPDIGFRALNKLEVEYEIDWKEMMNYCYKFSSSFYGRIIDENTQKLMALVDRQINNGKRRSDSVDPHLATATLKIGEKEPPMVGGKTDEF